MRRLCIILLIALCTTGFFFHRRGTSVDLTTSLELYLPFDGDLLDDSGNGNDATFDVPTAGYVTGPPSSAGQALDFDDTVPDCAYDTATSFDALGDMVISLWVRPDTLSGTDRLFAAGGDRFRVTLNQTNLDVSVTSNNGSNFADSANSGITVASYQHIVVNRPTAGSSVAVWIDKVAQSMDATGSGTPATGTSNYAIAGTLSCSSPLNGAICGVRVYKGRLADQALVNALFSRGCP